MSDKPLVIATEGAYSDYCVIGIFRWLGEYEPKEYLRMYLEEHPEQRVEYRFHPEAFVAWLQKTNLIEEVQHKELHLGSYHCPSRDLSFEDPKDPE